MRTKPHAPRYRSIRIADYSENEGAGLFHHVLLEVRLEAPAAAYLCSFVRFCQLLVVVFLFLFPFVVVALPLWPGSCSSCSCSGILFFTSHGGPPYGELALLEL